jgi:hypothetical protein
MDRSKHNRGEMTQMSGVDGGRDGGGREGHLGGGGAAGEAAGEEVADLAEAELGGAVARDGMLPRAAHGGALGARGGEVLRLRFVANAE